MMGVAVAVGVVGRAGHCSEPIPPLGFRQKAVRCSGLRPTENL